MDLIPYELLYSWVERVMGLFPEGPEGSWTYVVRIKCYIGCVTMGPWPRPFVL